MFPASSFSPLRRIVAWGRRAGQCRDSGLCLTWVWGSSLDIAWFLIYDESKGCARLRTFVKSMG
jgi:hypothetical protein